MNWPKWAQRDTGRAFTSSPTGCLVSSVCLFVLEVLLWVMTENLKAGNISLGVKTPKFWLHMDNYGRL